MNATQKRRDRGGAAPLSLTLVSDRARRQILAAIMLGIFLSILDQTIIGTALPRMIGELQGGDVYTWVTTVYLLASTITVPFYGRLSDLYGRRPLLLFGIATFVAGSLLAGMSQTMWQLILFRAIQGIGAGSLIPIAQAVIGDLYAPAERAVPQSMFGMVFALAVIVGPALGGFLTESASWHWVFFVNVPFGLIALAVVWRALPGVRRFGGAPRFDYSGAGALALGIGALLVGLTNKQSGAWGDPSVGGLIAAGLAAAALFVAIEARAAEPILPLALFRNRTFTGSMLATFLVAFGFYGGVVFLPLWFQIVNGATPSQSGFELLALLLGVVASAAPSGALVSRTGRYQTLLLASTAVAAVGFALLTQLRADTPLPVLWAWMFVAGVGLGPTFSVFLVVVQNAVPVELMGAATSALTFFRQIGGSVGLTIAGTTFSSVLQAQLPTQLASHGVPADVASHFGGGAVDMNAVTAAAGHLGAAILAAAPESARATMQTLMPAIIGAIDGAISSGVGATFVVGAAAAACAVLGVALIRELPLRPRAAETPQRDLGAALKSGGTR